MKKIAENDKCIFYENEFTRDFGDGYKIIVAEQKKNGCKEYLLLKDGKPVYASQNIENIGYRHDIYVTIKRFNKKHDK